MKLKKIDISKTTKIIKKNLPAIMTGVSMVGSVATAISGIVAGFKISEIGRRGYTKETLYKESVKAVIPTALLAGATAGASLYSHKLHISKEHALATTISTLGGYIVGLEKKLMDNGGKEALEGVKKAVLADKAAESMPSIKANMAGKKLVYEPYTDQYIWTTDLEVYDAALSLNKMLCMNGEVSLGYFTALIGGKPKDIDSELGWACDNEIQDYNWGFFGYWAPWVDISIGSGTVDGRDVNFIYYEVDPQPQNDEDKIGHDELTREYKEIIGKEFMNRPIEDMKTYIPSEE